MSNNNDARLILENYSNKFRGPGSPGVNLARGYLLQALELIEDQDVHLCADAEALQTTIQACEKAIDALSHDKHEVHEANKKPDGDGDGVPDWADKHHGDDDHDEVEED